MCSRFAAQSVSEIQSAQQSNGFRSATPAPRAAKEGAGCAFSATAPPRNAAEMPSKGACSQTSPNDDMMFCCTRVRGGWVMSAEKRIHRVAPLRQVLSHATPVLDHGLHLKPQRGSRANTVFPTHILGSNACIGVIARAPGFSLEVTRSL